MTPRPWLSAGLGGVAGTAVMAVALATEVRLRPDAEGPVDYDVSDHVVIAAARVLGRPTPRSERGQRRLFNLVRWGYGSNVALGYEVLRRALPGGAGAGVAFYAGCQTMTLTLFPVLGDTPPPWRWRRGQLISSFSVHALYAATVVAVSRIARGQTSQGM